MEKLWDTGDAWASIQVLQEFYVTVTRKTPHRLESGEAARIVRDLSTWIIFVPGLNDVMATIDLHQRLWISFWDAMIVWGAVELDCGLIWSENLGAGHFYEGVRVENPFTAT